MAQAFATAYRQLAETYGGDWRNWQWGHPHQARFRHQLFGLIPVLGSLVEPAIAHGGGTFAPNAGIVSFDADSLFEQVHGAGFRAVYDFADLERSRFMQALGQSGNFLSPHYDDLLPLWAAGKMISLASLADPRHLLVLKPTAAASP